MSDEFGIMPKSGLEMDLFAPMTPHRSAPGSPSKAWELYFMILKTLFGVHAQVSYDFDHFEKNMRFYDEEHDVQSHMLRPTITDIV